MLNILSPSTFGRKLLGSAIINKYLFSGLPVRDIRGKYLLVVEDKAG
jgi:hypothetical protein